MRLAILTASGSGRGRTLFSSSLRVWPAQVLGDEVRAALALDRDDFQDAGMVQLEADFLLAPEAVESGGVAFDLQVGHFDGDLGAG